MIPFDIRTIVSILGGDLTGPDSANVPGPGHSPNDRSLSIKVSSHTGQIIAVATLATIGGCAKIMSGNGSASQSGAMTAPSRGRRSF
jgi:hypothetical protein